MSDEVAAPGTRSAARRRALDILFEADLLDRPVAEVLARHRDDPEAGAPDPYTVELVEEGAEAFLRIPDAETADAVYIEPLTLDFLEQIIAKSGGRGLIPPDLLVGIETMRWLPFPMIFIRVDVHFYTASGVAKIAGRSNTPVTCSSSSTRLCVRRT